MTKILFLQGPPSTFWRQLADAFEAHGIGTKRVNFSFGDQVYWRKRGAINYRGTLKAWPRYLADLISREGITDIVYYADRLPYHRVAMRVARKLGIRCYAMEFGYLRPDWITLEREGMGRFSHFPNDPDHIRQIAAKVDFPDLNPLYGHTFNQEATNEVIYNLMAYFGRPMFPFYRSDKYYDPFIDYLSWLPRILRRRSDLKPEIFEDTSKKNYLLALQLQSDYQIRANSPFRHLSQMLEQVILSFARYAPENGRLIIKQHPLDNDMERWGKVVARLAARYRVQGRVIFIERGDLGLILKNCAGTIVANSTTALHSMGIGVPTLALGTAVYNVRGLTHQRGLDCFWTDPDVPDPVLYGDFVKAIAASVQVKGNFYNKAGRKLAAETIVARIRDGLVNEPGAYVERPPRLSWQRLPATKMNKQSAGLLSGGLDLPAIELPGGQTLGRSQEPALSRVSFVDMSEPVARKRR